MVADAGDVSMHGDGRMRMRVGSFQLWKVPRVQSIVGATEGGTGNGGTAGGCDGVME